LGPQALEPIFERTSLLSPPGTTLTSSLTPSGLLTDLEQTDGRGLLTSESCQRRRHALVAPVKVGTDTNRSACDGKVWPSSPWHLGGDRGPGAQCNPQDQGTAWTTWTLIVGGGAGSSAGRSALGGRTRWRWRSGPRPAARRRARDIIDSFREPMRPGRFKPGLQAASRAGSSRSPPKHGSWERPR
jgi:hypothetical protein